MSLNGLDASQLTDAFEAAQAEPGGWFWIKYATRDDVELLQKGTGGAEEMREVAQKEPEDSPLYGFIRFRRRSVLVKYIPEDTSRVLKARSQVHFQLVVERFAPHDTVFAISSPAQLTDSGLNSACSAHAATASISSSNSSLRQRRLADIAESTDEEEPPPVQSPNEIPTTPNEPSTVPINETNDNGKGGQGLAVVVTTHDAEDRDVPLLPPSKGDSSDPLEPRRKSSNSLRPSSSDLGYFPYTPKPKLGPRPHVESSKRPHTSERSNSFQTPPEELRASVPRSVHLPPRKSSSSLRSPSSTSSLVHSIEPPQPPAIPLTPSTPTSLASLLSTPRSSTSPASTVSDGPPGLTPEKQRLMRALELRRQNLSTQQQKDPDTTDDPNIPDESTPEESTPTDSSHIAKHSGSEAAESECNDDEEVDTAETVMQLEHDTLVVPQPVPIEVPEKPTDKPTLVVKEEAQNGDKAEQTNEAGFDGNQKEEFQKKGGLSIEEHEADSVKVRDDVESESEAGSNGQPLDTTAGETQSMAPQPEQATNITKSIQSTAYPEKTPTSPQPPPSPLKLPKREQSPAISADETPVIETARSVSAPFLKGARLATSPGDAVPKKVNVAGGGGSVANRIKQFQMLSNKLQGDAAAPAPALGRSNSQNPGMRGHGRAPSLSRTSTAPVSPRSVSDAPRPTLSPPRASFRAVGDLPSRRSLSPSTMEIIERDNKPELQVTTRINRDEQQEPIRTPIASPTIDSPFKRRSTDLSSPVDIPGRRSSESVRSFTGTSPENREKRNSFFSRSRSPTIPENNTLPLEVSGRRGSTSSRSSSEKSAKSLLKRMSSTLSRKKDSPPSPPPPPPADEPKTYRLAGWINVQLPDTMLWRRRCMKIDSHGWLSLSLTEDENAPQSRRYHIQTEVSKVDLPDLDEQELPYSVRVFMRDGVLQCACQNMDEQKEILRVIRECMA